MHNAEAKLSVVDEHYTKALAFKNVLATAFDDNIRFTEEQLRNFFMNEVIIEYVTRDDQSQLVTAIFAVPAPWIPNPFLVANSLF